MHRIAYIFVGSLALIAVLTVVVRLFLPDLAAYKDEIAAHLSRTLGVEIQIGDMQVALNGMRPEFHLSQVEIDVAEPSAETVHVEELRVGIDLMGSLLGWQLKIFDLYIAGTHFLVVTDEAGNSRISGFLPFRFPSSEASTESEVSEIAFHLERADVRWRNEQVGVDYEFANVYAGFEYHQRRLKVSLDTDLPEPLGRKLRLMIDLEGVDAPSVSSLIGGDWFGKFYLGVDGADVQRWTRLMGRPDIAAGVLTAELRGDFQGGALQRLAGSVACDVCGILSDAVMQDAISLQTSLSWMVDADGWILELPEFSGEASGITVRNGSVVVDSGKTGTRVALQMPALDVARAVAVATRFGWLPADLIAVSSGQGDVSWSGLIAHPPPAEPPAALSQLPPGGVQFFEDAIGLLAQRVVTYFEHLRIPSGISTSTAQLALEQLSVQVPDWSQRVFDFDAVAMDIGYHTEPHELRIDNLSLRSDDMRLSGEIAWAVGGLQTVNARLFLENLELASVKDLLPEQGLRPGLKKWLEGAFVTGVMNRGQVEIDGALSSFPFNDQSGRFSAWGEFTNVTLNYRANRQPLSNIDGRVTVDNEKLVAEATRMSYYSLDFLSARAVLSDILVPFVAVDLVGEGPVSGIFSYLGDEGLLDPDSIVMRNLAVEGSGRLDLAVAIPLSEVIDRKLTFEGSLDLGGNALRIVPLDIRFEDIEGTVQFGREGGTSQLLQANFNGARVTGRAEAASGGTRLVLETQSPATQLFDWVTLPLPGVLRGTSLWQAELLIPQLRVGAEYQLEMTLRSSLEGTAVALPSPLGKTVDQRRDVAVAMAISDEGSEYDIRYGDDIAARLIRDAGRYSRWSGHLHFGQDDPPPFAPGLFRVNGEIAQAVDLDEWFDLMSEQERDRGYLDHVTLSFAELHKGDAVLGKVAVTVEAEEGGHRFEVDAPWMSGWGIWPRALDRDAFIKLDRLFLPKSESTDTTTTLDPRNFPSVELEVGDFRWGEVRFSDLQLVAEPSAEGLKIGRLGFQSESVSLSSRGTWSLQGDRHTTRWNFSARGENYGRSLQLLGLSDNFRGGNGEVRGEIAWEAWPGGLAFAILEGDIGVDLADGVIEKADPGVGRLFGLLSTDHIMRRLSLDFSDVVEKGLSYDSISGNFNFHRGIMHTDDLVISGPALLMKVQGDSDTIRRQYDQYIEVVPNFSSGLPVASALLGGPIAGAALYLLDKLTDVGSKVDEILALRYHLHGDWEAPQIEFQGVPGAKKGVQQAKDVLRKIIP